MRIHTLLFIFLMPMIGLAQTDHDAEIKHYRDSINHHFGDSATSILEEKDQVGFKELDFYPNNAKYLIEAVFEPIKNGKAFKMKTSTERLPVYRPYGKLKFEIDGEKLELTVYQNVKHGEGDYPNHLFLPFTDETNGDETYGGGRYLDLDLRKISETVTIDFNKCYNPYCAYNGRYSCPIPPKENHLKVKIEAGVKAFDH